MFSTGCFLHLVCNLFLCLPHCWHCLMILLIAISTCAWLASVCASLNGRAGQHSADGGSVAVAEKRDGQSDSAMLRLTPMHFTAPHCICVLVIAAATPTAAHTHSQRTQHIVDHVDRTTSTIRHSRSGRSAASLHRRRRSAAGSALCSASGARIAHPCVPHARAIVTDRTHGDPSAPSPSRTLSAEHHRRADSPFHERGRVRAAGCE